MASLPAGSEAAQQAPDALAGVGHGLVVAQFAQRRLEALLELRTREAAAAGGEMALHRAALSVVGLVVDEVEELAERLVAVDVALDHVRLPSCAGAPGAAARRPMSRACRHSSRCNADRARARRERTVPTGTSSVCAI